jgi:hypothetical protein
MRISIKASMFLSVLVILILGLLAACSGTPATSPPTDKQVNTPITLTPSSQNPVSKPERVELVYFHSPQRCPTCICFEERINKVVQAYFQNELKNGGLTWGVYDLGDNKNAAIITKYRAVGSQLFINTITGGIDNIKDIQEIWNWGCLKNDERFDKSVKNVIDLSLRGEN